MISIVQTNRGEDDFAPEFDAGAAAAQSAGLPDGLASDDDMAAAHYLAGLLCGNALKLADTMGEANAKYALELAYQLVQTHCAGKREPQKGN